jgi:hypothetical protein
MLDGLKHRVRIANHQNRGSRRRNPAGLESDGRDYRAPAGSIRRGEWRARVRRLAAVRLPLLIVLAVTTVSSPSAALSRVSLCDRIKGDLRSIRMAVQTYQIENDARLPRSLSELIATRLLDDAQSLSDPWGHPYLIVPHAEGFEIVTFGPDRVPGTTDDFSSAAVSPCPSWPSPNRKRAVIVVALLTSVTILIGFSIWLLKGKKSRAPRTTIN